MNDSAPQFARKFPLILLTIGLIAFTVVSVYFVITSRTGTDSRAANSASLSVEGTISKLNPCITQLVCYKITTVNADSYNLYAKSYPKITGFSQTSPQPVIDFEQYLNHKVEISGFLVNGSPNTYLIISDINILD